MSYKLPWSVVVTHMTLFIVDILVHCNFVTYVSQKKIARSHFEPFYSEPYGHSEFKMADVSINYAGVQSKTRKLSVCPVINSISLVIVQKPNQNSHTKS